MDAGSPRTLDDGPRVCYCRFDADCPEHGREAGPTLDDAWKAAEAALPKGEAWDGQTLELGGWHCGNNDGAGCDHDYTALVRGANDENLMEGRGRTPVEALLALAARLNEGRDG